MEIVYGVSNTVETWEWSLLDPMISNLQNVVHRQAGILNNTFWPSPTRRLVYLYGRLPKGHGQVVVLAGVVDGVKAPEDARL